MVAWLEVAKPRFSSAPCITQRFPRSDHSPALHSRASTCTRQIPSSAVPGYAQDTPKAAHSHSDSSSSLGQSKPWTQEQPLPTPAAARDTTSLLRSTLHLIFWSLRYQYQLPTPWHCRNSPGPGRSTLIPTHSTSPWLPTTHKAPTNQSTISSLVLPGKLLCSGEPDLTPQQAPHLQPAALSSSSCFITSSSARCLCLPEKGPTAAEPAVIPIPLPPSHHNPLDLDSEREAQ